MLGDEGSAPSVPRPQCAVVGLGKKFLSAQSSMVGLDSGSVTTEAKCRLSGPKITELMAGGVLSIFFGSPPLNGTSQTSDGFFPLAKPPAESVSPNRLTTRIDPSARGSGKGHCPKPGSFRSSGLTPDG